MGWVMSSARKQLVLQRINNIEFKQMKLSQRLLDLHKYSSSIASDGYINFTEMAGMPTQCFDKAMQYATFGHLTALAQATNRMGFLLSNPNNPLAGFDAQLQQYLEQDGLSQEQYDQAVQMNEMNKQNWLYYHFEEAKKEALKEIAKAEKEKLKYEEDEINQEMEQLKAQLQAATTELQTLDKAIESGVNRSAPKYV